MPARHPHIKQASFGEEFLAEAPLRESEPTKDKPVSQRVDPQSLKSAAGVVHQPAASIAKVVVDDDGNVVEGHLLWMLAMDERRSVTPEHHHYVDRERFDALCEEVHASTEAGELTRALVVEAVVCGRHLGLSVQEIARALNISRSHVSRLVRRAELIDRHRSFFAAGLSISHLEAVSPLDQDRQVRLLTSALEERWTVRRLEKRIREDELTARRAIGFNGLLIELLEDIKLGELATDWKAHPDEWCAHLRRVAKALDERPHIWALLVPHGSRRTA
jgi:AraC-like DNA-binding protein